MIAYDQRGHGRSPGLRGGGTVEGLVDDLTRVVRGLPGDTTVLLGQSMGALLVLRLLQRGDLPGVAGAILSAPWLRTRIPVPAWKRHLGTLLERLLPRVALPTPSEPGALTRDPDRQAAHRADPLVHHRVTPRLFFSVEAAQERLLREGIADPPPLLFLLPGADRLTDARAAETLASSLPSGRVRVEWLPDVPHEPFQDVERVAALAVVADWLDALPGVEPRGEDRVV